METRMFTSVEERVGEELAVVGEPVAGLRLQREHEAVEERIDEERDDEKRRR
jgi:hypothetical protein